MSKHLDCARSWHTAIQKAMMEKWDPIGVRQIPSAQDEYDAYIPSVYRLLVTRRPKREIFDYLWWLETQHMGLKGDRQQTEDFASYLHGLSNELSVEQ